MVWSPRQLGELADTSRRAVRHYQEVGLLPEPERQINGYSQYGVAHLIRLLRIRRLTQLGFTLPQIAAMGDADEHPAGPLRELDAELATKIEHLQETRRELAVMLERAAPTDLPLEIASHIEGLPAAERALLVVLSRVLDPVAIESYVDLMRPYRQHSAVIAFDDLAVDSDEASRNDIATGIAEHLRQLSTLRAHDIARIHSGLGARSRSGAPSRQQTVNSAIKNLYNTAQLDVLAQARRQLRSGPAIAIRAV